LAGDALYAQALEVDVGVVLETGGFLGEFFAAGLGAVGVGCAVEVDAYPALDVAVGVSGVACHVAGLL